MTLRHIGGSLIDFELPSQLLQPADYGPSKHNRMEEAAAALSLNPLMSSKTSMHENNATAMLEVESVIYPHRRSSNDVEMNFAAVSSQKVDNGAGARRVTQTERVNYHTEESNSSSEQSIEESESNSSSAYSTQEPGSGDSDDFSSESEFLVTEREISLTGDHFQNLLWEQNLLYPEGQNLRTPENRIRKPMIREWSREEWPPVCRTFSASSPVWHNNGRNSVGRSGSRVTDSISAKSQAIGVQTTQSDLRVAERSRKKNATQRMDELEIPSPVILPSYPHISAPAGNPTLFNMGPDSSPISAPSSPVIVGLNSLRGVQGAAADSIDRVSLIGNRETSISVTNLTESFEAIHNQESAGNLGPGGSRIAAASISDASEGQSEFMPKTSEYIHIPRISASRTFLKPPPFRTEHRSLHDSHGPQHQYKCQHQTVTAHGIRDPKERAEPIYRQNDQTITGFHRGARGWVAFNESTETAGYLQSTARVHRGERDSPNVKIGAELRAFQDDQSEIESTRNLGVEESAESIVGQHDPCATSLTGISDEVRNSADFKNSAGSIHRQIVQSDAEFHEGTRDSANFKDSASSRHRQHVNSAGAKQVEYDRLVLGFNGTFHEGCDSTGSRRRSEKLHSRCIMCPSKRRDLKAVDGEPSTHTYNYRSRRGADCSEGFLWRGPKNAQDVTKLRKQKSEEVSQLLKHMQRETQILDRDGVKQAGLDLNGMDPSCGRSGRATNINRRQCQQHKTMDHCHFHQTTVRKYNRL
eukprot:Gregarina_sp_Poly_1__4284@NODE_232_length_11105_cov_98_544211_g205_i0_p2_GENE_NODE_232_length_11105_cov_98_544211_g205_i0NODE_232_length_11105_cov_98_544211_g205_i0_p2_ORF_typecomplete_len756_score73_76Spectrin_like/PF18373_1/1_4e02Spectrin_like/PF18373_1/2_1e02Spectrin_like/PF18373_1/15_NODE_232_length_11105_cov_98_544211_g205_i072819548